MHSFHWIAKLERGNREYWRGTGSETIELKTVLSEWKEEKKIKCMIEKKMEKE